MIHISLQNVLDGNGLWISITGMVIVFSGLLLISSFIARLPHVLSLFDRLREGKKEQEPAVVAVQPMDDEPTEEELNIAIGLVIHMELERTAGDLQKITIARGQKRGSFWTSAAKMRILSNRSPYA